MRGAAARSALIKVNTWLLPWREALLHCRMSTSRLNLLQDDAISLPRHGELIPFFETEFFDEQ